MSIEDAIEEVRQVSEDDRTRYLEEKKEERENLLNTLLYCCECMSTDYSERNIGQAESWVRHISKAWSDYNEAVEEDGE